MAERFKAMRGTHDILPQEARLWRLVESGFVDICKRYGYQEIRVPIFEATELFERGTGFSTDVVQKEMYTFPDKKGRSLSLRPEATPSVVRAYLEHGLARKGKITKLFYLGPMFRYDRPGAGRYRQFHQLGIELIGTASAVADAEVIEVLWRFLQELGLRDLEVRLNSLGCKDCRVRYSQALRDFLSGRLGQLCADCKERFARNPLRVLDCKNNSCRVVIDAAPDIGAILCQDCTDCLEEVKEYLERAQIDFYLDSKLVRGLDYYTRTVFEVIHPAAGIDNSLGGGGRYDELVSEIGGPSTPAVGFSAGLERILLALRSDEALTDDHSEIDLYVAPLGKAASLLAFDLAGTLRKQWRVWLEFDQRKLDRQLRNAAKLGARFTLIIGDDEMARGTVRIKDMSSGEQYEIKPGDIAGWLVERRGG